MFAKLFLSIHFYDIEKTPTACERFIIRYSLSVSHKDIRL